MIKRREEGKEFIIVTGGNPNSDDVISTTIVLSSRQEIENGEKDGWLFRQPQYEETCQRLEKRGLVELTPVFVRPTEAGFYMVGDQRNEKPN